MIVQSAYKLAFQKSPIFLTGGIAQNLPGQTLPIIALTEAANVATGVLNGNIQINLNLDDFYADFTIIPGGTLHNNQIGMYPFANQIIAANAIISQPLNISLKMNCTPRKQGGMVSRLMTATALKNALDNHNYRGGTYSIATPAFLYTGCIMTTFKDITSGESKHVQTDWQIDFVQPLTSTTQTDFFQNSLMSKITGGIPSGIAWSGI